MLATRLNLNRFDRIVGLIVAGLALAIAGTILLGDRVGVRVLRTSPAHSAQATSPITLQFSDEMDRDTLPDYLVIDPPVAGDYRWSGATLIFQPEAALQPGETYTVTLTAGAASRSGRAVLADHQFAFTVQPPRVAFLSPADGAAPNVYTVDPTDPAEPTALTSSPTGVYDFAASPDGTQLAYSVPDTETGLTDIRLLDLTTGEDTMLVRCPESDCHTPVWSPDGRTLAYERMEFESDFNLGASPVRIWLLDMTADPPTTQPLYDDPQVVGYTPQWSPDGTLLASYSNYRRGIFLYNFETDEVGFIPADFGNIGAFSPDSTQLAFPITITQANNIFNQIAIADLASGEVTYLNAPDDPVNDQFVIWTPDGSALVVGRRYLDDRYTPGRQLYLLSPETGDVKPLVVDANYYHGFYTWDPTGQMLVLQRFQVPDPTVPDATLRTEVWVYDTATEALTQVGTNVFLPGWIP
jgi:Tol biopolymer transport system component